MHFQEDLKQSSQSGFSLINCYIYRYLIEPPVRYVVEEGDALMNLIQNCEHWHADIPLLNVRHVEVSKPGELVCPGGSRCHGGP